jgi:uncharacterized protein YqgC (DUF456 family)
VENTLQFSILWITQFFMLVGLVSLLLPIPGLLIMWLAALGYGLVHGFNLTGIVVFGIITLLMVIGSFADNLLMGAGAHRSGASCGTIALAMVAGVLGMLIFPPLGGFVAAPLAILLLEYYRLRDWQQARQAVLGFAKGWGLSFVARFLIGLTINGLWWLWVWLVR